MKFIQSITFGTLFVVAVLLVMKREDRQFGPYAQVEAPTSISITPVNYSFRQFEDALVESIDINKKGVVSVIASKDFAYYFSNNPFRREDEDNEPQIVQERREIGGGSGIFVHKDGYVLTNRHVVNDDDATYTIVFYDGSVAQVEQIWRDPLLDLAVVKIDDSVLPEDVQPATIIGLQQPVQIGQFTYAIGNTLAQFQNSVTLGIISGRNREIAVDERNVYVGLYQTDTPISMGNSGGPLFDIDGQVIGINTAVSAIGENIGFALPITQEFVDATLASIKEYNQIRRPFIGIRSRFLTKSIAQELDIDIDKGMYINEVVSNSPAAVAGLQIGDVLIAINGLTITDEYPLLYQLYTYKPEQTIIVTLIRNNQEREVELNLGMQ